MGNSSIKQQIETASKTGVLTLRPGQLKKIPKNVDNLSHLRSLDISGNKLKNLPNLIEHFKNLKILILDNTNLMELREEIGYLIKLECLSLNNNSLAQLPISLGELQHLNRIFLRNNNFCDFPVVLCSLKKLDVLDLSENKLTGIPDDIKFLNVIELILCKNRLSMISDSIADCPRLKVLRLDQNCLSVNSFPRRLFPDSQVTILTIDGNKFDPDDLKALPDYDKFMQRYFAATRKRYA